MQCVQDGARLGAALHLSLHPLPLLLILRRGMEGQWGAGIRAPIAAAGSSRWCDAVLRKRRRFQQLPVAAQAHPARTAACPPHAHLGTCQAHAPHDAQPVLQQLLDQLKPGGKKGARAYMWSAAQRQRGRAEQGAAACCSRAVMRGCYKHRATTAAVAAAAIAAAGGPHLSKSSSMTRRFSTSRASGSCSK